jgi:hypothetical protein
MQTNEHLIRFRWKQLGFRGFLEDDEMVEEIFRRPFSFTFSDILVRAFLWGGLAWGVWWFYPRYDGYGELFFQGIWFALLLFALYKILGAFLYWYVNAVLMTNENIIFVDWPKLFQRRSTRIDYWNLDQIEVERIGWQSFLYNYGTLNFQKVSGGDLFSFTRMSKPHKVAKIIEAYRELQVDNKNFTEESALKDLLSNMVQSHVRGSGQPERPEAGALSVKEKIEPSSPKKKKSNNKKGWFGELSKNAPEKFGSVEVLEIEVEKKLDDEGGIEIDLDEKR